MGKRTKTAKRSPRRRVLLALGWYAAALHRGVASYAHKVRWVLNTEMERGGGPPPGWKGDGIICVLGSNGDVDALVASGGTPAVSIGPITLGDIPSVTPDHAAIGRMACEHFLERGFRHFAFFIRSGSRAEQLRLDAFRRRVEEAGYRLSCIKWFGRNAGRTRKRNAPDPIDLNWLGRQLVALPKPLAVFAEFDDRAIEILEACENAGISVPEEVAVMGVDNDELRCPFAPVPLSSIDDDQSRQGFEAARILDDLMSGSAPAMRRMAIAPLGVTTRESTDILAIDHPNVAKALRIIWERYTEPLTAKDVSAEVPMSDRRLHDAFVRHVGRTMAEEISRRRIEHARRLLEDSDWKKLEDVAWRSGFSSADHMCKVFSRTIGVTPSSYRREHTERHPGSPS